MESITGRVALVTGGGRGIGRAIALSLARAGAHVAVAARTVPEIEQVAAEIKMLGCRSHFLPLDLSNRSAVCEAPALVEKALGPIEILVNNAGIHFSGPVQRTTDAEWDGALAVNLTAPFLLARACLPSMYGRLYGRIINVASVAGRTGVKYAAAYVASKHGLVGMTRALALEAVRKNVTCNALCPGWTDTQMMEQYLETAAAATGRTPEEIREACLKANPRGQPATPEEVAQVAVLLATNPAINGQALHVDGGEVMT